MLKNLQIIFKMETIKPSIKNFPLIVKFLLDGGVVIFPTDTVYGFLADASNKRAVNKIYKIKNRPKSKPLPVFVSSIKTAKELAEIDKEKEKTIKKYWPGKYTFVLNSKNSKKTIALRIPKYKPLNYLLNKIKKPLVQTSVNISGDEALRLSKEIINTFKNKKEILFVDGGNLPNRKSSTIIDLTKDKKIILRK